MKKIFVSILLAAGCMQLSAQSIASFKFKFGGRANASLSNFAWKDHQNDMGLGASLGSSNKLEFGEGKYFALQSDLVLHYKTSAMKDEAAPSRQNLVHWGIEKATYAVGQLKIGSGKAFIGIGPYVGYGFSAKSSPGKVNLYKEDEQTGEIPMRRWDFGAGVVGGYEFANGIFIHASYQAGALFDWRNIPAHNATVRSQTLSVGIGYRFRTLTATFKKNSLIPSFHWR